MPPGLENPHTGPHRGKQRGMGWEGLSDSPLSVYIAISGPDTTAHPPGGQSLYRSPPASSVLRTDRLGLSGRSGAEMHSMYSRVWAGTNFS